MSNVYSQASSHTRTGRLPSLDPVRAFPDHQASPLFARVDQPLNLQPPLLRYPLLDVRHQIEIDEINNIRLISPALSRQSHDSNPGCTGARNHSPPAYGIPTSSQSLGDPISHPPDQTSAPEDELEDEANGATEGVDELEDCDGSNKGEGNGEEMEGDEMEDGEGGEDNEMEDDEESGCGDSDKDGKKGGKEDGRRDSGADVAEGVAEGAGVVGAGEEDDDDIGPRNRRDESSNDPNGDVDGERMEVDDRSTNDDNIVADKELGWLGRSSGTVTTAAQLPPPIFQPLSTSTPLGPRSTQPSSCFRDPRSPQPGSLQTRPGPLANGDQPSSTSQSAHTKRTGWPYSGPLNLIEYRGQPVQQTRTTTYISPKQHRRTERTAHVSLTSPRATSTQPRASAPPTLDRRPPLARTHGYFSHAHHSPAPSQQPSRSSSLRQASVMRHSNTDLAWLSPPPPPDLGPRHATPPDADLLAQDEEAQCAARCRAEGKPMVSGTLAVELT